MVPRIEPICISCRLKPETVDLIFTVHQFTQWLTGSGPNFYVTLHQSIGPASKGWVNFDGSVNSSSQCTEVGRIFRDNSFEAALFHLKITGQTLSNVFFFFFFLIPNHRSSSEIFLYCIVEINEMTIWKNIRCIWRTFRLIKS